tara:strand:- start:940 stop:1143 length:204 start_codon:yes stop_codon:yes gene_type:complete
MNAYILNSRAGRHFKSMICKHLNIKSTEIYKTVKDVKIDNTIILHDGRKFKPMLKEVEYEKDNNTRF